MRDEWLRTIKALQGQISEWVRQEPGWAFEEAEAKEIEEASLGLYRVSVWSILTPEGEVRLDPIARNYPSRGIVEMYAWPTAHRVRLIQSDNGTSWRVLTDSGIYLHQPWDREHLALLIRDLVGAEDMIAVG